jgi:ribosomal protein S18 acetylase RimI-like enzyme
MSQFFIRTAAPEDIPAICNLLAETWRDTYTVWFGPEKVEAIIADWHSPESVARKMARIDGEMIVADDGRSVGGMASASLDRASKTVTLHQLYVHPALHRCGIGRDLLAELESCFDDAERMVLEVEPRNAAAIAFYKAHGFGRGATIPHCGQAGSGLEALMMEKHF